MNSYGFAGDETDHRSCMLDVESVALANIIDTTQRRPGLEHDRAVVKYAPDQW
jgi:hypothetical protein